MKWEASFMLAKWTTESTTENSRLTGTNTDLSQYLPGAGGEGGDAGGGEGGEEGGDQRSGQRRT